VLDPRELESLFTSKTRSIILNTPHNPIGKVFSRAELELIANLCKKHNVLVISDEVYEWMVYAPNKHIRMGNLRIFYHLDLVLIYFLLFVLASLPDMWERTITICSAGKTFSVTGWKLGWAYGPDYLMRNLQTVHQNTVYTCPTPIQACWKLYFDCC
jgi:kynurenine---oxoglutarate transaminase / cysteine-S-conjugate beta-lyase / glutamine---phenylpyruvate transaminase